MTPAKLDRNIAYLTESESDLTLIMTINARHASAFDHARDYVEVIRQSGNAGFCFVAGNATYLTEEERVSDAVGRLTELVAQTRRTLPEAPIFVGSEGLAGFTHRLSEEHSTIPFALLGSKESNLEDGTVAVYCPCYLAADSETERIRALGSYAMRRGWVRQALRERGLRVSEVRAQLSDGGVVQDSAISVLGDAIQHLALCGLRQAEHSLRRFSTHGIAYVALLPATESDKEAAEMARLASRFN